MSDKRAGVGNSVVKVGRGKWDGPRNLLVRVEGGRSGGGCNTSLNTC